VALPSIWRSYARALTARRPPLAPPGVRVEGVSLEARQVVAPAAGLAAYRRTCGFAADAPALPLTYPHALASPLHLALLTGPAFPVRPLGLVHLRNTIRSLRRLPDAAPLDLRCRIEGPRETERGQEFELVTEVRVDGALGWSETAVVLARRPGAGGGRKAPAAAAASAPAAPLARWELPADLGRRYAAASGDWNPIHLTAASARLFGFRRAIVQGMWSLARCVAELDPGGQAVTVEAAFKLPVFLPATVALHATRGPSGTDFALTDGAGARPHLTGSLRST
jgi:acyl dehydratase